MTEEVLSGTEETLVESTDTTLFTVEPADVDIVLFLGTKHDQVKQNPV